MKCPFWKECLFYEEDSITCNKEDGAYCGECKLKGGKMAEKIKIIGVGKLDMNGLKSIGKSFLITVAGAAIGFVANLLNVVDFGSWQTLVATALPFIANTLYKWLGTYESKK